MLFELHTKGLLEVECLSAMMEFSGFINSCGLIHPPLEGGHFTWSSREDVPVLSRINHFFLK